MHGQLQKKKKKKKEKKNTFRIRFSNFEELYLGEKSMVQPWLTMVKPWLNHAFKPWLMTMVDHGQP